MEIRTLQPDEEDQAFYLGTQAFGRGNRERNRTGNPNRIPRETYGVWDEAGLQAKVVIIDYRIHLGPEVIVPMGGVAGVASLPASRGRGYAGACLKYALQQMRERGQVVSTLYPFSWEYYRRLGWEWVGVQRNYKVLTNVLKSDAGTEAVRAATPTDRAAINDAYTRFAQQYRGLVVRSENEGKLWNDILDDTEKQFTYTYLFENAGAVDGYLTFRGGKEEETHIREFVALTPQAQRALLGLLRRHEMQTKAFAWAAPDNDLLWSQIYHWDVETKLEPVNMGRVVDVAGALQIWKPSPDVSGRVTLAVQDEAAPWNTGTWRIEAEAGTVSVSPSQEAPQVSLDIQALSQAYFGTPNLNALRRADRITVSDEAGFNVLKNVLNGPPMWTNDSF